MRRLLYLLLAALVPALALVSSPSGEVLCNGVVLPAEWPPKVEWEDIKARKPMAEPPYLVQPPADPGS